MLSIKQIGSRLKKGIKHFQSENGDVPNYFGFWDFDKKDIVLRMIGFKAYSLKTGKKEPIYATEVMRYYPMGKQMLSHRGGGYQKREQGKLFAYVFDRAVRFPSGLNFSWGSYFSKSDPRLIHLKTKKNGKPFELYNCSPNTNWTGDAEWYAVDPGNEKYYNLWYRNESEFFLTKKEYEKIKNYRMPGLKTNLTFLEHIEGSTSISVLHKYISQSFKYNGLRIIFKNDLYKHLEDNFLKKVIVEDTKMFKKMPENNIQNWYINLIKKDLEKARMLNVSNVMKVFKGKDPKEIKAEKAFLFAFTKAKSDILGNNFNEWNYGQEKIINKGTEKQQEILKMIRENLFKLPMFKEELKGNYYGNIKEELKHLYDYLEYRSLDHEITKGILLDKNWKDAFEALRDGIELHKNKEKEKKRLIYHLDELKKYKKYVKETVEYDIRIIERILSKYPEFKQIIEKDYPDYVRKSKTIVEEIKFQEKREEERKAAERSKIEKKIIEFAEFIGINETEIKKGEEVDKYKLHTPLDLQNYNDHAKKLNQCIYNNMNFAQRHIKAEKILIYIEKNGEIFATAELSPNGTITGFTGKQTFDTIPSPEDKVEKEEQKILEKEIKEKILPKLLEIKERKISVEA